MTPDGKYIFAVDFDGTLSLGKWPDLGIANFDLFYYLIRERDRGNKVILWTNRSGELLKAAITYCERVGLYFDAVNENLPEIIEAYGGDSRKISADIYIDDRSIHPEHVSWSFMNTYNLKITDDPKYGKEPKDGRRN